MAGNVVQDKSFHFAVAIVPVCRKIAKEHNEFVLSRQLLRSGTSIGANIEEAIGGLSRADFAAKLGIAYKEARATSYWLRLLKETGLLSEDDFRGLYNDAEELCRLIASIHKKAKVPIPRVDSISNS
ncbi:MAG: four helix bundle protein [Fimbriimonadaceae bacterium]|nr:four helix bundle protein [Fimbriimonadaceae bacterium]